MLEATDVQKRIETGIPGAQVRVQDLTGGADHFAVEVVAEAFAGQTPIKRHRMVYAALGEAMSGPIHALQLTTRTPDEG